MTTQPRVYLKGGTVSHYLQLSRPRATRTVLCQRSSDRWLGTASDGERERAEQLPICAKCHERAELSARVQ